MSGDRVTSGSGGSPPDLDYFTFEVRSAGLGDVASTGRLALEAIAGRPPSWVDETWAATTSATTEKSSRAKPHVTITEGVSPSILGRALDSRRSNRLSGVAVSWLPPSPSDQRPIPWTRVSVAEYSSILTLRLEVFRPAEVRHDRGFGLDVFRMAIDLVRASGDIERGAGWFGSYPSDPFFLNAGRPRHSFGGTGYPFLGCFTPREVELLGGPERFRSAPIERWEQVTNQAGHECVVTLLAESPERVTNGSLRAWRDFLRPVLDREVRGLRASLFDEYGHAEGLQWERPALVLPEDWPT